MSDMRKEMEKTKGHVVVVTYPAQGHINPLLQFAKCLVSKGLKVTLAATPYTADSIRADGIDVMTISDGFDDGGFKRAPGVESYLDSFKTVGSRTLTDLIHRLNETTSSSSSSSSSPAVNCIVYDSLLPWAIDVAKHFGICVAVFWTNLASIFYLYWQINSGVLTFPVPLEKFPLSLPGLPPLGVDEMPDFLTSPTRQHRAYLAVIFEQTLRTDENDYFFANTFEALEFELAKDMAEIWPVQMIGPMVPSAYLNEQLMTDRDYGGSLWKTNGDNYMKWLDKKPRKSVIFVSFGSMTELEDRQIEEIAWGLKISNHNFLWIIKETDQTKLPIQELLDSTEDDNDGNEKGLILSWCNQLEVLASGAVGCFVTHCGWNSILEAMSLGVPMVAMPQRSDQPMNAKLVEEFWKVGVRVRVKKDDGDHQEDGMMIVRREEISRCIMEVMGGGETCEELRRNCSKWREYAKGAVCKAGTSDNNINKFVELLMKGKGKDS